MAANSHSINIHDLARIREIAVVLARHGFGRVLLGTSMGRYVPEDADEPTATVHWTVRVRKALVELGPTFVKLGQILSVRPDIVPVALATELQYLLDRVDPIDTSLVLEVIEEDLQSPVDELFDNFGPEPLASASLAQVYRATLHDGTPVAVKVQRPGIEPTIRSDVRILYTLARLMEDEVSLPGMHSLPDVIAEFETALYLELDFLAEARACERFKTSLAHSHPKVFVPRTYPKYSSRRVLVLELCEGQAATVLTHDDPRSPAFARALIDCMFTQVFENGFFHGDPHPGNLMVMEDYNLGFLDFGLTGTLTAENQQALSNIFTTLVLRDAEGLALAVYHAGGTRGRVDLKAFRKEVAALMEKYNGATLSDFAERENLLEIIEVQLGEYLEKTYATFADESINRPANPTSLLSFSNSRARIIRSRLPRGRSPGAIPGSRDPARRLAPRSRPRCKRRSKTGPTLAADSGGADRWSAGGLREAATAAPRRCAAAPGAEDSPAK